MELGHRTPLVDLFRRGEAPRDVRLLAARAEVAPRAAEQLVLLVLLAGDDDPEVAAAAVASIGRIPRDAVAALLAQPDVPEDVREFFGAQGITSAPEGPPQPDAPLFEADTTPLPDVELEDANAGAPAGAAPVEPVASPSRPPQRVSVTALPIVDRVKLAMRGTREQRALLVRDPNRLVAAAVLSSPKLTESEVEGYARMGSVAEDVLRTIGSSRAWLRNYAVVAALVRNPKTPPAISLPLVPRLNERDLRMLSVDRNVPEPVRVAARKFVVASASRRK